MSTCLDCPFRRDSDPSLENPYEFVTIYFGWFIADEVKTYECPETGSPCHGQKVCRANCNVTKDHDLIDRDRYFWFAQEMRRYHEEGYIFGAKWLKEYKDGIGRVKEVKYDKKGQGSLF